jgi:hypothetical protein
VIAQPVEEGDRNRANATGSTGYEHSAAGGGDAYLFQGQHAKHGGVSCGADRHGFRRRDCFREPDKPIGPNAGALRIAAVVHLSQSEAVQHDAVPCLEARIFRAQYTTGQVDAWDKGEFANNWRLARYREAILIVHCRVLDCHGDVSIHQIGIR